jgi:hypothetical protein
MSGYTVVQFLDWKSGKSTLAVPQSWIVRNGDSTMCYFPKKNAQTCIKNQDPARADWLTYTVKRLTSKLLPTLKKAEKKVEQCLETSTVETSDTSEDENTVIADDTRKRKHNLPKRYLSDMDDAQELHKPVSGKFFKRRQNDE